MTITPPAMAAAGAVVGLLVWLYLRSWSSAAAPSGRLVAGIVCIGLIGRIAFAILTPAFQAPDEQAHFNYVKYLDLHRAFPVQQSKTGAASNDWEYYQPPLYYLLSLPVYRLARQLSGGNDQIVVRALRFGSIILWAINLHFARRLLDRLQMTNNFSRAFVLCIIALLPTYTTLSAAINNDNLLITFGGLFLYVLSYEISGGRSVWLGILLGLALLTKLTAVVYAFAFGAVLIAYYAAGKMSLTTTFVRWLTATGIAAAIWLPWGVRNVRLYGDITGESVANIPHRWDSRYEAVRSTLRYMARSFSSVSGIHNNIEFLPLVGTLLLLLAGTGLCVELFQRPRHSEERLIGGAARHYMLAMALTIIVNVVLVLRFGLLYDQGQGRFLYPMLVPIAICMAGGIRAIGGGRKAYIYAIGFLASYLLAFTGFSLAVFYTVPLSVLMERSVTFP